MHSKQDIGSISFLSGENIGCIIPWPHNTIPQGCLVCDGSAVSRTLYSKLFSKIGTEWGYGDNLTTFNIPNLVNRYVRGRANGSTNDPDRTTRTASATGGNTGDAVGSLQTAKVKIPVTSVTTSTSGHQHTVTQYTGIQGAYVSSKTTTYRSTSTATSGTATYPTHTMTGTIQSTKPNTMAVKYIIYYGG